MGVRELWLKGLCVKEEGRNRGVWGLGFVGFVKDLRVVFYFY